MADAKYDQQLQHAAVRWERRKFPLIVACDDWQDPRNVGMAFRLAESFGLAELWLGGSTPQPPNRKLSKTARSTVERVPYRAVPNLVTELRMAKTEGYARVGIEITKQSRPLREIVETTVPQPTVLVLGAESVGIQATVLAELDTCAHIPMYGQNTSLNVATALGIALYAWTEALSM
ncbi:MAG: TrmH family RNA methyltransferase [Bacteroidota bacterium]